MQILLTNKITYNHSFVNLILKHFGEVGIMKNYYYF